MTVLAVITLSVPISGQDAVLTGIQVPVIETENGPLGGYIYNDIHTYKGNSVRRGKAF
ncbi:hypothetical protein [Maribacter sp. ACAM166]|uniref:hypothetical protein n=1 Tax=Maribacter sp. ACAM166 TaxID=2508996 RepID=UPI002016E627|nr:hypothetical protein [Maribacter sp. ACAM166]